jgi:flavin reductase (DIM6/NTAB) family NADH-FMN oxidoreductase RutF
MKKKIPEKVDFDVRGFPSVSAFPLLGDLSFPLVGQVVLVTSRNREGTPNVSPLSSVCIFTSKSAIVGFGVNSQTVTAKNILSTGEFIINVPGTDIIKKVWKAGEDGDAHPKDLAKIGLTPLKAVKLAAPRVGECKAHLECSLDWTKKYGDEVVIFGRVLLASVNKEIVESTTEKRYSDLKLFTSLENSAYGLIRPAKKVIK